MLPEFRRVRVPRSRHENILFDRSKIVHQTGGSPVIRYRSLRDLIDMSLDPAMEEGRVYKYGALDHTEVFITRPTISFLHIRVTLAFFLILLGWAGYRSIDWIHARRGTPSI
jgi:hypothetical protein